MQENRWYLSLLAQTCWALALTEYVQPPDLDVPSGKAPIRLMEIDSRHHSHARYANGKRLRSFSDVWPGC